MRQGGPRRAGLLVALAVLVWTGAGCATLQHQGSGAFGASDNTTSGGSSSFTPTTSSPASGPTTTTANDTLTAFGATTALWNANHTPDPAGSGYWPRLPSNVDAYTNVVFTGGKILSYREHLYPVTTLSDAVTQSRNEVPPDAKVQSQRVFGTCAQAVLASATVERSTGGDVLAEFTSTSGGFDQNVVDTVTYRLLAVGASLPGC